MVASANDSADNVERAQAGRVIEDMAGDHDFIRMVLVDEQSEDSPDGVRSANRRTRQSALDHGQFGRCALSVDPIERRTEASALTAA
jgi:hypothetical protein